MIKKAIAVASTALIFFTSAPAAFAGGHHHHHKHHKRHNNNISQVLNQNVKIKIKGNNNQAFVFAGINSSGFPMFHPIDP